MTYAFGFSITSNKQLSKRGALRSVIADVWDFVQWNLLRVLRFPNLGVYNSILDSKN